MVLPEGTLNVVVIHHRRKRVLVILHQVLETHTRLAENGGGLKEPGIQGIKVLKTSKPRPYASRKD